VTTKQYTNTMDRNREDFTLQKSELISQVSTNLEIDESTVDQIVTEFLNTLCKNMQKEETIVLQDFGIFKKNIEPERIGRNPLTGNEITIPSKAVVSFMPGRKFKESLGAQ
jgi:DNA-binding protein HU-beta